MHDDAISAYRNHSLLFKRGSYCVRENAKQNDWNAYKMQRTRPLFGCECSL